MDLLLTQDNSQVSFNNRDTTTDLSPGLLGTGGFFTDGNPATPTAATQIPGYYLNTLMGELYNLLLGTGITPNGANYTQIYQAVLALKRLVDTGVANTYAASPANALLTGLPALSAIPDGFAVTLIPLNTNTGASVFEFNGGAGVAITDPLGNALQPGDILAGVPAELMKAGGSSPAWWLTRRAVRRLSLGAAATFYVNAGTGNDTTGNGTSGAPWATLQHAWNYLQNSLDCCGFAVTINATGAFTAGLNATMMPVGCPNVYLVFGAGSTLVGSGSGLGISVVNATLTLEGTVTISNWADGISIGAGGQINLQSTGINFGAAASGGAQIYAPAGHVELVLGYTISGGAAEHWVAPGLGYIGGASGNSVVITLTGTPAFTIFAWAYDNGVIEAGSGVVSFSGAATGPRYEAVTGLIQTNGGGASFLPGNSSGSGSQYY